MDESLSLDVVAETAARLDNGMLGVTLELLAQGADEHLDDIRPGARVAVVARVTAQGASHRENSTSPDARRPSYHAESRRFRRRGGDET